MNCASFCSASGEEHIAGAIDPPRDRFNLVLDRLIVGVQVVKHRPFTRVDDRACEFSHTGPAAGEAVVYVSGDCAGLDGQALEKLELLIGIARTPVDCDYGRHAERVNDPEVARTFAIPTSIAFRRVERSASESSIGRRDASPRGSRSPAPPLPA